MFCRPLADCARRASCCDTDMVHYLLGCQRWCAFAEKCDKGGSPKVLIARLASLVFDARVKCGILYCIACSHTVQGVGWSRTCFHRFVFGNKKSVKIYPEKGLLRICLVVGASDSAGQAEVIEVTNRCLKNDEAHRHV